MFDLAGKIAVVTGGSRGIGRAVSVALAEAGAHVLVNYRSNEEAARETLRLIEEAGGTGEILGFDVADPESVDAAIKDAVKRYGHLDILVNNAGYHARGAVRDVNAEDLGRIIDVNLKAPIILTRLALPYLEDAGGGVIINVASLHGRLASPGASAYSASKFGLRIFTFALREELEGSGIKAAVVSPGPVDTGFIMENLDEVDDISFSQPMSTAEDVGQAILDLCGNNIAEQAMPKSTGILATIGYLMPWLGRFLRPMLERKGARVKARYKAERRRKAAE